MEEKVQKKRTRPRIQIDLEKVEQLAQVCDNEEDQLSDLEKSKKRFCQFCHRHKKGKG